MYNSVTWAEHHPVQLKETLVTSKMSHVKATEDTPENNLNAAVIEGLGLYCDSPIHFGVSPSKYF